jgi:thioredoxin-related protein
MPSAQPFSTAIVLLCVLLATPLRSNAEEQKKDREPLYDPSADAKAEIDTALARARRDGKRVLVKYGGNWCGWCYRLHDCFERPEIRKVLRAEYELVLVDIRSNEKLPARYNAKPDGYPYLTILDANGKVVSNESTVPLEVADHHDPEKVLAFLEKWKAPQRVAEEVLAETLEAAKQSEKRVLLTFGAPWCGWCHKLEDFLARDDIKQALEKDWIVAKIDIDRMKGGKELLESYRKGRSGGVPWFVIVGADGKEIVSSVGAKGNCGYPVAEHEIAHFMGMLAKTARKTPEEAIGQVRQELEKAAAKLRS